MNELKKILLVFLLIVFMMTSVACGSDPQPKKDSEVEVKRVTLTISAAASLTEVMEEIKTAYTKENTNIKITYNFGSSGSLQQQIEQGAEVDVFVSAATKQMNTLSEKGLIIEETRKDFLENKIVLIVPKDSSEVLDFQDLTTDKVKSIGLGDPESVPVGQYSDEVLTNLELIDAIKPKVVYGKDVKQVLTWVETGNVDVGMVYETDALISDQVKIVVRAPEGTYKAVYYPAAVIKESNNEEAAIAFVDFLYSSEASVIFERYGFVFRN